MIIEKHKSVDEFAESIESDGFRFIKNDFCTYIFRRGDEEWQIYNGKAYYFEKDEEFASHVIEVSANPDSTYDLRKLNPFQKHEA